MKPDAAEASGPRWLFEPLQPERHNRGQFSCGVAELDRYIQRFANQDRRKNAAITWVQVWSDAPAEIAGYYTLSSAIVQLDEFPQEKAERLPRYPNVPATLIGRLARDERYRGKGIGELLLMDALHRSLNASHTVASAGVLVEAKDDEAARFYEKYDFARFPKARSRLFIPMTTVAKVFE